MRESLKHLFGNQLTLQDGSQFWYSILPYELLNPVGASVAILSEYSFSTKDQPAELFCKLYRTKEGNWYDIKEAKMHAENHIIRMLKAAVEQKENSFSKG